MATERLVAAVESAIGAIQERLANLATDGHDAKWSVSDLVKLLQLRTQSHAEPPSTIFVCWVNDLCAPGDTRNLRNNNGNHNGPPEYKGTPK